LLLGAIAEREGTRTLAAERGGSFTFGAGGLREG